MAPYLVNMGIVKAGDAPALATFCEAVARFAAAARDVARFGLLVVGDDGAPHKNPAVAMMRDASHDVRMWAREFGLTPSARAGIRVEHVVHGDAARLLTNG
jgi:P27 family predicted phage terminase small subunit